MAPPSTGSSPSMQLPPPALRTHGDRGPAITALQVVMMLLATSAVVLRFVARRMSIAGLWWDDWLILGALVFSIGINVTNLIASTSLGLGKHIWDVEDHGRAYLQSLFALELLYTTALALVKLSVLVMYHRLFRIERRLAIAARVIGGITIAWWIGVEIATLLQCRPISALWDHGPGEEGQCVDLARFFVGSAIPNVMTDVWLLILPQPLLWKLKISWTNKIAICGIFLLGAFTAVSSIGRLITMIEYHGEIDFTWDAFKTIIFYSLEPAIGIICACLPCMGPLLSRLPGSPFGSQQHSHGVNSTHGFGPLGTSQLSLESGSLTALPQRKSKTRSYVRELDGDNLDVSAPEYPMQAIYSPKTVTLKQLFPK